MRSSTRKLVVAMATVVLTAAALLTTFGAGEAVAQVRAAIVKSVDEPGRSPYFARVNFHRFNCEDVFCILSLPPVPAGKRLVVTHISGMIGMSAANALQFVTISDNFIVRNVGNHAVLAGPFFHTGDYWTFDRTVMAFFDAGTTPAVRFYPVVLEGPDSEVAVNGYLVEIP